MGCQFYYRNGCHLCEQMASQLNFDYPLLFAQMEWLDVDEKDELIEKFNDKVPVLVVDGEIASMHFLDKLKLDRLIISD